ncbi:MAG TPA: fibronectin type III domain-containing protein, partial [Bacteroidia bacterium]|nr:fibronectin type III domain-containing protein [Bacteroidia bacterium]
MKKIIFIYIITFCNLIFSSAYGNNDTLINSRSVWKYRDNGSNQGSGWKNKTFNDAAWPSDTAQFGYGDGDETTIVSYGTDPNNRYITTYFRKTFTVANPSQYDSLQLQILRDDGARVFLNGTSVARSNLPTGTLTYTTLAKLNQGVAKENKYYLFNISPSLLSIGNNVIAVEVHQFSITSDDLGFDLRLIGKFTPCAIPDSLAASNITVSSAQLDWSSIAGAISYNVQYRIAGSSTWTTVNVGSDPLNISSLSPASDYEWQVQTVCSTDSSTFSSLSNFTTPAPPCDTTSNLTSSNITTSSAYLSWNAVNGAISYNVQYRIIGSGSWTSTSSATNNLNISPLSPSSNYEWQVQTVCSLSLSAFTSSANFVTLTPPCDTPSGLVSSGITTSSSNLSWNAATGAISYTVQYRIIGSGSWISASSVTNNLNIMSLTPASNYEWQVQTVCSSSSSTFSSLAFFTTLTPPTCDVPTGILITAVTSSSATVSWTAVAGAVSYIVQYRLVGGTWNQVSTASATVNLTGLSTARTYECKVQTVCSSSSGNFSESASFTTLQNIITDSLILANGVWKYLDNGSNQGTSWRASSFNDASWASGPAELGYGDGDEGTVVSYGPNSSAKYITTYFRKTITIPNPSVYTSLALSMIRDDGAVVYINGTEVFRSNMPSGTISYTTLASAGIGGGDESTWQNMVLTPSQFVSGSNVIAVEIHQSAATSTDISFKMRLAGMNNSGIVTTQRGPYLQMLTPNSIHIRWKTDVATNGRVRCGTDMSYGTIIDSSTSVTEHEVKITGLNPGTKYYYTIGSSTMDLQGDKNNYFKTSLPTGSTAPFRVWAIGDFGNNSANQDVVRDAYLNYAGNNPANFSIWLGDNAYATGTEAEFTTNVFAKYPGVFKNTPLYPGLGNHDYANIGYQSASALGTNFPYFNLFTCPSNGQAGGIPSGTEKYYSFNYGNAHFIAIDSYGALNNPGSP